MDPEIKKELENAGWENVEYFEEEGRHSAEATYNNNDLEISVWFGGEEITVTSNYFGTEMEYDSIPTPQQGWEDTWTDDSDFGVDPTDL